MCGEQLSLANRSEITGSEQCPDNVLGTQKKRDTMGISKSIFGNIFEGGCLTE